jgi:hypothetical protein
MLLALALRQPEQLLIERRKEVPRTYAGVDC